VHGILAFLVTGADSGEVRRCSEIRDPNAVVSEQDVSWFEIFVLDMLLVDIRKSICSATVATIEPAETYLVKLVPKNCCESTFCVHPSFVWFFIVSQEVSRSSRKADSNGPEQQSEPFPMGIRSYYADVFVSKPFHRFNLPAVIEPDSMSAVYILPR